ncbi:MAG: hypothetical protein OXI40_02125 [Chloroflexota bacterium]|nr:hypothetical protein [Chloroflexota bacterium]
MSEDRSRGIRNQPPRRFERLALLLALLPLGIFAYLGQFSRLMSDDYCAIAVGREMGAWQGTRYWFNSWAGSYANFFFKSALAPLDELLPRVTPIAIIIIWTLGAFWLACLVLQGLGFRPRRLGAIAIASALATASLNAFYSPQSYYWFAASTHYALPLALLTVYLALCAHVSLRGADARAARCAFAGALLCFCTAGASEIFVAFQLTLMTLLLLPLVVFWRRGKMRRLVMVAGAGWIATAVGFLLQVMSPGLAARAAVDAARFGLAIRDASDLLTVTLGKTFQLVGHPPAFAGFMLLFAISFLVLHRSDRPGPPTSEFGSTRLAIREIWIGLVFQLLWIPLLWTHVSDDLHFFGRFSAAYLLVVALNLILIVGFLVAIRQRDRLGQWLSEMPSANWKIISLVLFIVALLFALTQARSIHYRAASFLFTSAISLLYVGTGQLDMVAKLPQIRQLQCLSLFALVIALISLAAIVFTALIGRGFVDARILAPASFALVLPGLLWGALYGIALGQSAGLANARLILPVRLCLTLAVLITLGIVIGNGTLIPGFQQYAGEWDARHQQILSLRDAGHRSVEVAPLEFDLADYVGVTTLGRDPSNRCALRYYDLDALAVRES